MGDTGDEEMIVTRKMRSRAFKEVGIRGKRFAFNCLAPPPPYHPPLPHPPLPCMCVGHRCAKGAARRVLHLACPTSAFLCMSQAFQR